MRGTWKRNKRNDRKSSSKEINIRNYGNVWRGIAEAKYNVSAWVAFYVMKLTWRQASVLKWRRRRGLDKYRVNLYNHSQSAYSEMEASL